MLVESSICYIDQITIEAALCNPAFVPSHQHDGFAFRVKSKCDAPYASIGIKTKFLHVGMARTLKSIN